MICPRCSIAEIRDGTHQCPLCEFSPNAGVLLDEETVDEVRDAVQRALPEWYRIDAVERLGERSFVYRARDLSAARDVALKVIPVPSLVDHELAQRFERHLAHAATLRHAHIVSVLQYGTQRSFLWYAMDLIRGMALSELLRESGPMELEPCLRIIEQVGSALDFAHRNGVMHGNLKPSNILLDAVGWVRVTDFAVIEVFGPARETRSGSPVVHRPEYLAPERFVERTSGASADQYALAVIVYQCLTGALPFVGDAFEEVARQHATEPPPRLSEVRSDLPVPTMEAVQRALSKVPSGRFASVLDFTAALGGTGRQLRRTMAGGVSAQKANTPVLLVDQPSRVPLRSMAVAGIVIVGALIAASAWLLPETWRDAVRQVSAMVTGVPGDEMGTPAPDSLNGTPDEESVRAAPIGRVGTAVSPPRSSGPAPGGVAPTSRQARVPGLLIVNSKPWGRLVIDGEIIGNTPQLAVVLSPGMHIVRVERDGYAPFEQQIQVSPQDTVRMTGIALRRLAP